MNMVSNSARVHFSLDPTDHELGTLSPPIDTTTDSEHHNVKGYLGPAFLQYFSSHLHIDIPHNWLAHCDNFYKLLKRQDLRSLKLC